MAYIYKSQFILKGNEGRSSNQEPEGRAKLEIMGELSFSVTFTKACAGYFHTTEDFLPGVPTPKPMGLATSIYIKNIFHIVAQRQV